MPRLCPKSHTFLSRYLLSISNYFVNAKMYILYSMNVILNSVCSMNVVSASDVTPTDRWLNVWCIWYTYLETLQECRSRRRIGWIIQDFRETCVLHSLTFHLETKMPWRQTPSRKKKAVVFTNVTSNAYQDQLNAGFSKLCEIFKVCGIESLKYISVCYCDDISMPRNVMLNETTCDWLFDMSVMGGPWPMKAAIYSRPSAVSLKVWLRETSSMNVIWTYYIRHVVIITWPTSISSVASLPFSNLQNLAGSSRSSGYFCLLFYEYCEFRHTYFVTYCFCLLCSREICDFGCSPIVFLLSAALILQSHYNLRHTHFLWILKQTGYDIALGI